MFVNIWVLRRADIFVKFVNICCLGLKRKADFEDKLIQKEPYTPKFVNISTKVPSLSISAYMLSHIKLD